jgi:hypothetical protein
VTLPGVVLTNEDQRSPSGPSVALSTVFLVGELARGPEAGVLVRSLRDLQRLCGARTSDTAPMHDWLDAFFREGGGQAYVTPLRGPAAAAAHVNLLDGASAVALAVTAKEKGTWANGATGGLSVVVTASGGNFTLSIRLNGVEVENTGTLADGAAAAAWSETSKYVDITDGVGGDPAAVSATNLASGDDDFDGITNTEITAAFDRFSKDLGPGVTITPGRTTTAVQLIAAAHASTHNRIARCDLPDTSTVATITTALATLRASAYADIIDALAPTLTVPGLTPATTRTVPASVLACAAEARNDNAGVSPNQPAAGRFGEAQYATAPTITWTEADLETLNDAGARIVRTVRDRVEVYGNRTVADPTDNPVALRIGSARLRMAIHEIVDYECEQTVFEEIDSEGVTLGNLEGRITASVNSAYGTSSSSLTVGADVIEDDQVPGSFVLEVEVAYQARPDAEVVRARIVRNETEV